MTTFSPPPGPASPDQHALREAEEYAQARHPVELAAVAWHGRREAGLDAAGQAELQQWLTADAAHAGALDRLDLSLRQLRHLPAERIAHLRRPSAAPARPVRAHGWRGLGAALTVRNGALACCCVALLALGLGWRWWTQPVYEQSYTSAHGQRRDIMLPDGSLLVLDTDTRVEVSLYRNRRLVRLPHGQAMFNVARDAARPFRVQAGPASVTVLGTRFAVRCSRCEQHAGEAEVEVEEGHVSVAQVAPDGGAPPRAAELHAGQAIQVGTASGLGTIMAVSPASIAPWRKGLVHFASTPLAEAIREFERYAPLKLLIRDPQVAAMPIGGSYRTANPAAFVQVLPHILPVRLLRRDDGITEVVRKN